MSSSVVRDKSSRDDEDEVLQQVLLRVKSPTNLSGHHQQKEDIVESIERVREEKISSDCSGPCCSPCSPDSGVGSLFLLNHFHERRATNKKDDAKWTCEQGDVEGQDEKEEKCSGNSTYKSKMYYIYKSVQNVKEMMSGSATLLISSSALFIEESDATPGRNRQVQYKYLVTEPDQVRFCTT